MDAFAGFRLNEQVALLTGASKGIGLATARLLGHAGATVVLTDVEEAEVKAAADELAREGISATARALDVTNKAEVDEAVDAAVRDFGRLDVLMNNAGFSRTRPVAEVTPEEFTKNVAVNLEGVLYGCQAAARVMLPGSSIINTLSSIIDNVTPGNGPYAAAKFGAWGLTRAFAAELGPKGIRVNGVAPGFTITTMSQSSSTSDDGVFDAEAYEDVKARMAAKAPLGVIGDPMDQAHAAFYLASPAAKFVTGQVIRVNGGTTMP